MKPAELIGPLDQFFLAPGRGDILSQHDVEFAHFSFLLEMAEVLDAPVSVVGETLQLGHDGVDDALVDL